MIPLPLQSRYHFGQRNRPLPFSDQRYINVTDRYWPLPIDTDRYRSLPNFTVTCVTSVTRVKSITDRNKGPFEHIYLKFYKKFNVCWQLL